MADQKVKKHRLNLGKRKMTSSKAKPYWQTKKLTEMTMSEWEALCDGCGRCCLNKVHYVDTKEIYFTRLACRLLDCKTGQCKDYANRKRFVPNCIELNPKKIKDYAFLPKTCAYRLLDEGQPLYSWHPLISGVPLYQLDVGVSVTGFALNESPELDPEDFLIEPPIDAEDITDR